MRLAIVGFGLIGGSIARALRDDRAGAVIESVAAWSPSGHGPAAALADGVIERAPSSLAGTTEGADLIVLAADPLACLGLLDELDRLPLADDPPTITDVASTKALLVGRADRLGLHYVGGHPMAGLETTGYANARPDLFVGRPWVLCPGALSRPVDLERVEQLVVACRAEAHWLGPAEHDRAVAAVSHLPLIVAAALVEGVSGAEDWPLAERLAAGGWLSATRLARGDETMGAGIAATNAPELVRRLRSLQTQLDDWLADLEVTPDDPGATADRIRARLSAAKQTLEAAG